MQCTNRHHLALVAFRDCQEAIVARWHLLVNWMRRKQLKPFSFVHSQPPSLAVESVAHQVWRGHCVPVQWVWEWCCRGERVCQPHRERPTAGWTHCTFPWNIIIIVLPKWVDNTWKQIVLGFEYIGKLMCFGINQKSALSVANPPRSNSTTR